MFQQDIFLQLVKLLVFDAIVVALFLAALIPLSKKKPATFAVLKRNFVGYFSNPTGYVFICVFVFLCSVAAFWSQEFFARNLATLDQLNFFFPFIMLVFVPAITMSIWSQERSQGTDELLLTIPATDMDIVLGKYLAAASIYSVALLFSQFTNFMVLNSLAMGDIDLGLFLATYTGYWLIGLAMLSLGMAASFLTSNLTVSFILGAIFNAPLVCLTLIDRLVAGRGLAQDLSWWGYAARFTEFGRGVLSFSSALFFLLVTTFGIYLSLVLIGRRHWFGGSRGKSMVWHYLVRAVALGVIVFGVSKFFSRHDPIRIDVTRGRVSSLSSETKQIVSTLDSERPIRIEAFISKSIPESYVKTKRDLTNVLAEFASWGGDKIDVRIHDNLLPSSDEATRAKEQYGIEGNPVRTQSRGQIREENVFLGAAVSCGRDRVIVPFFDRGIPVEYELVRSISTVTQPNRKRVGVVKTDAELFGGFSMMGQRPKQLIIEELEKQFDVEEVDLASPIRENQFDVLMVVQPSSLTQPHIENLIAAIRNGQPTAIFEDPMPIAMNSAPGTGEPRRPQGGGMFGGGQPPEPKGNYRALWNMLGIEMVGAPGPTGTFDADIIWQVFNPYRNKVRVQQISPEWVFISPEAPGSPDAFDQDDTITSGLRQVLLLFPGGISQIGSRGLDYEPLMITGDETGTITTSALRSSQMNPEALKFARSLTEKRYLTAVRIRGTIQDDLNMSDAGSPLLAFATAAAQEPDAAGGTASEAVPQPPTLSAASADDKTGKGASDSGATDGDAASGDQEDRNREVDVVFVSDIDMLHSDFLAIRAQPDELVPWNFDNVTFVLNIIDSLAGDESLIPIRKRQTRHSTLTLVEKATSEARSRVSEEREKFDAEFEKTRQETEQNNEKTQAELQAKIEELQQKAMQEGGNDVIQALAAELQKAALQRKRLDRVAQIDIESARNERDRAVEKIENNLEREIEAVQTRYKLYAGFLPIIPPIVVGAIVWLLRRRREREGITDARRRL